MNKSAQLPPTKSQQISLIVKKDHYLDLDFDLDLDRDLDRERERWEPSLDLPGELLVDFTEPLGLTLRERDSCTNPNQMSTKETEQELPMHQVMTPDLLLANHVEKQTC